ncbi:unnamed protein product [Oppiella nova]|uniref:SCP domain-containing protein n=1 Tax=Oppiella nova TaxID=334625 RepID=A0A7R9QHL9_9ACAR|nr:unnamed protein product [Oppiella nova]CAG2165172.1 unnamed protein product [Oppiella nova]
MMYTKIVFVFTLFVAVCFARNSMPDKTDDNFQNDCLQSSNTFRAKHHSPGFKVDPAAVAYAKSRCALISQYPGLSHGHAGLKDYGENLYWAGNSQDVMGNCQSAINSWYNEVSQYNYDTTGFSGATGHFTQLVWKSTTNVGCARCYGKEPGGQWYETYVVCNYKPAGNIVGDQNKWFKENVLRP